MLPRRTGRIAVLSDGILWRNNHTFPSAPVAVYTFCPALTRQSALGYAFSESIASNARA